MSPVSFPPLSLFTDHTNTVSHALSHSPTKSPKSISASLFPKPNVFVRLLRRFEIKGDLTRGREWTEEELDQAAERGTFPSRPSDLFLKMYSDVLLTLTRDPLAGNVSPSLLGTSGVVPLSIVAPIPVIMKHYERIIISAKREVFLVTNYWQPSDSVNTISNALRELSKRVGARGGGEKVIVKIMWDRGSFKQLFKNHIRVTPQEWIKLDLPSPDEVPHLEMEVVNFHRPLLGTFHQKSLIVDRRVALLNSNNIQDRPNLEMMVHLEGAVVDSLYDTMLISWHEKFSPPLPCVSSPSPNSIISPVDPSRYKFRHDNLHLADIDLAKASRIARNLLNRQMKSVATDDNVSKPNDIPSSGTGAFSHLVSDMMSESKDLDKTVPSSDGKESETETLTNDSNGQSQSVSAESDRPHLGHTPSTGSQSSRLHALADSLNSGAKEKVGPAIEDESAIDDFQPHFLHKHHTPVPIALVNRKPHGLPGHQDIRTPQDAAWLAGLRYAKRKVFIQTPTLNAAPIVRAILEACTRENSIVVELFLDLGFNDAGESVPFQGGTNEQVVTYLFKKLRKVKMEHNLHVYWYTGKDQVRPLNAKSKSRNCHVKFFAVDDQVAIQGNGNQDTQSWFHSQEANIMIDSPQIVSDWMTLLRANQSTGQYGRVDTDGIWRDQKTGEEAAVPKNVSCFTAIASMI